MQARESQIIARQNTTTAIKNKVPYCGHSVILSVIAVGYPLISIVLLLDLILFVLLKRK